MFYLTALANTRVGADRHSQYFHIHLKAIQQLSRAGDPELRDIAREALANRDRVVQASMRQAPS